MPGLNHMNNLTLLDKNYILTKLEEMQKETHHGIPFYAYGDNQAGCEFSNRLDLIDRMCASLAQEINETG